MPQSKRQQFEYDVCLSFAGEDRNYVSAVAAALMDRGIRIFYDEYEEVALWGKDLYEHLHEVYGQLARYCVVFVSKHYRNKLWTNHERKSAQERAFKQHSEYILPARFDNTQLPGMRDTVGYIDLSVKTPKALAELIAEKIGARQRTNYFPPHPNRLIEKLPLDNEVNPETITSRARWFFNAMLRADERERMVVFAILQHGCPAELPENIHINLDFLRRVTGIAPLALKRLVGGLGSLGFFSRVRRGHGGSKQLAQQEFLVFEFHSLQVEFGGPATETAVTMVNLVTEDLCSDCGLKALMKLDFGQLSTATHHHDPHGKKKRKSKRGG